MAVIAQDCVVSGVFLSRGKVLWKLTSAGCFLVVSWLQLLLCTTSHFWNFFSAYFPIWKRRHTAIWMDPEDTALSEKRQSQEEIHCMIPLTGATWSSWIHRDRQENDGCQGLREGEMQIGFMPTEFPSRKTETSLRWIGWWMHSNINVHNATKPYTWKWLK